MRIGIVGAGVAGSYLARLLSGNHEVTVYERQREDAYKAVCGWAASKYPLREFSKKVGLSFDDYILHEGKYFTIVFGKTTLDIKATGLVTFDKERFEKDLRRGENVIYGVNVNGKNSLVGRYDLLVDATGFYRSVIGPSSSDIYIPTIEYMVRYRELPFDDFYSVVFPGLTGFLWFFPLGRNTAHVGAGDLRRNHARYLEEFLSVHKPEEVLRKVGRPVRLAPPKMINPLVYGNVYAVGESAGVVFPTTGEGIIPSVQNALLFAELVEKEGLDSYEREVSRFFDLHNRTGEVFFNSLLRGRRGLKEAFTLLLLARNFNRQNKRFGLKPGVLPLVKAMISYAGANVLASFK